jgi:hypothetical protein
MATKENVSDMNLALLNYYTKTDITTNYYNKAGVDMLWSSLEYNSRDKGKFGRCLYKNTNRYIISAKSKFIRCLY